MEGMCNYPSAVTTTLRSFAFRNLAKTDARPVVSWGEATLVFAIFMAAQVADGLLTYWGVTTLGIHVEGNDLLATTMYAIGPGRALLSAKLLACVCGYILYRTASYRPLAIMAGLYIGVAVTPWLLVFGGPLSIHWVRLAAAVMVETTRCQVFMSAEYSMARMRRARCQRLSSGMPAKNSKRRSSLLESPVAGAVMPGS